MSSIDNSILQKADKMITDANAEGIMLRLTGGCAVQIHCKRLMLGRKIPDIDTTTYHEYNRQVRDFFVKRGFRPNDLIYYKTECKRHMYENYSEATKVDVFVDKLHMCHTIDFRGRLELDFPTMPLADLLLCKMQIVQINEKDIRDVIMMLREHEVGATDEDTLNAEYVGGVLARNWGFYHTVRTNLTKVRDSLTLYPSLTDADRQDVASKIDKLIGVIESQPKSNSWKIRARIGTKKRWYDDVEELVEG